MSVKRPSCPTCKRGLPPQWPSKKVITITGAAKLVGVVEAARKAIAGMKQVDGLVCLLDMDLVLDLMQSVREIDRAQGRLVEEEMPF